MEEVNDGYDILSESEKQSIYDLQKSFILSYVHNNENLSIDEWLQISIHIQISIHMSKIPFSCAHCLQLPSNSHPNTPNGHMEQKSILISSSQPKNGHIQKNSLVCPYFFSFIDIWKISLLKYPIKADKMDIFELFLFICPNYS